ncbi:MAG: type II secretion system F family protein [Pseudomonadota bacterium]|nr:type II secretion system F family protein [Pseudomonadota bacterium]MDE3037058.1 type II secretion system F family protein [Pseudomonadota bacterium]
MRSGEPFQLSQALPYWINVDDFYVALTGVAAFLCVWAIGTGFSERDRMAAKIKGIQERRRLLQNDLTGPKKRRKPEASVNFMRAVVMKFQLIKKNQIGKTESTLVEAGFRSRDAIVVLAFFNLVLPIALGILGIIAMRLNANVSEKWRVINYIWPVLGAYVGLKLPGWYVGRVRRKRYLHIQRALSDTLDLMTICAEAGLSFTAMLDRVSKELSISYPEMAEELAMTSLEIGFLPDRNQALSNLAKRCTLQEMRGIVSVLIQTEKYGTPIAQALRVLSTEFRQQRMLRAEHKAAALPAKMTVPMILCILPVLFIVIIAPAVIKLLDTMNH